MKESPAMPNNGSSSRTIKRVQDDRPKLGRANVGEKSKSFHGQIPAAPVTLRRPRTQPELHSAGKFRSSTVAEPPRLTKLLLNVTVQRSLGPVQVLISPESTVGDLVKEALRLYIREGRRPLLSTVNPADFDLHYSQFSLESLDTKEKLIGLGSRNFFMCPKTPLAAASCSKQADKVSKTGFSWLKIMDFLL